MSSNYMFVIGAAVLAMVYSFWKTRWIEAQDEGTDRMKSIGKSIADGAMAFLKAEYRVLAIFVLVVAILLGFVNDGRADSSSLIALSFIVGAVASGLAGFLGIDHYGQEIVGRGGQTLFNQGAQIFPHLNVALGLQFCPPGRLRAAQENLL